MTGRATRACGGRPVIAVDVDGVPNRCRVDYLCEPP